MAECGCHVVPIHLYVPMIFRSLPARTSIAAAANPVGGHYNRGKTVAENLKLVKLFIDYSAGQYLVTDNNFQTSEWAVPCCPDLIWSSSCWTNLMRKWTVCSLSMLWLYMLARNGQFQIPFNLSE